MTEELKQAAQQALEALSLALSDVDWRADSPTQPVIHKAHNLLQRALTAAQPAQAGEVDERVAFEAWASRQSWFIPFMTRRRDMAGSTRLGQYVDPDMQAGWQAWQARASLPTQPAAQATPVQDVGASADYWGDLAQQKADADARRGVSMPVSYYTSSIVGALLATQQATPEPGLLKTFLAEADRAGVTRLPDTFAADLASATPPQQAAGEPVAWFEHSEQHDAWFLAYSKNPNAKTRPLVFGDTHPAPGVPEPTINWFGTHFTYQNQPCDNVTAWRFGEAAMTAKPGGDLIDHGLSLLHELEKRGYGIYVLAAAQAKGGAA